MPHVPVSILLRCLLLPAILIGCIHASARASTTPPVSPPANASATGPATVVPADALTERAQSRQLVWSGVVVAPDGRTFVVMPRLANSSGPQLAQLAADGTLTPYPDAGWNRAPVTAPTPAGPSDHAPGGAQPAAPAFVGLTAIRLSPDGALWAVDTGSPGFGKSALPDASRLIRIDLGSGQVTRVLTLSADMLRPKSVLADIRFNGGHAYVTDAGAPGLIVVDLAAGSFRRVLDHDPALTGQRPVTVDGEMLKGPDGKPAMNLGSLLEVTPDGRYLYVQPFCGPMSRIATALLDDPQASPRSLSNGMAFWYDTPALGGMAIAADGTLYLNDLETDSILTLSPARQLGLLLHDPRLHWAGGSSLGSGGVLTVPVPQLDRAATFHHGHSQVQFPVGLYSLKPVELAAAATQAGKVAAAPAPGPAPAAAKGPARPDATPRVPP
ncbi:L-dopachrome tautomerase-related protein [Lichenicola sp.]|uniref:L-dopachrome tautomerase-related protein n=1 Tax=Lichenicola sp. TaxID=2804529 RepID=UPI003AFFCB77